MFDLINSIEGDILWIRKATLLIYSIIILK
jgi:hypothetical protein